MAVESQSRVSILPESMDSVVLAIGHSAALSIVHCYAGTRLYVPRQENMGDEHPLVDLLGRPLAEKLARALGGEYLVVPVARAFSNQERERIIVARATAGESYADIAQSLGMTERAVQATMDRVRTRN